VEPDGEGTLISDEIEDSYPPIVTVEEKQALMQISTRDFSFVAEHHISQLFTKIADQRLQVNMMQNSAISFSVCVNDIDDKVDRFIQQIDKEFKVILDRNLRLITLRHYNESVLQNLLGGKIVMLEERSRGTIQAVVKDVPVINWKHHA
jgi:aspartate kinase